MAADFDYKQMLLELDKSLKDGEFNALMFLCKDEVKKREREDVKRPTDLWEILETREKLGPSNLQFLKQIIFSSCDGRLDVMRIIENFENGVPQCSQQAVRSVPPIYNPPVNQYVPQPGPPVVLTSVAHQLTPSSKLSMLFYHSLERWMIWTGRFNWRPFKTVKTLHSNK